jgi:PAS domain S-box-containing protein
MNKDTIELLLIEDNPGDVVLIREILRDAKETSFHIEHVDYLSSGLEYLKQGNFDVILLDLNLPDSQGLDTFLTVQTYNPQTPIVILTGLDDRDCAMNAMQHGAQDYLIKGNVDTNLLTRSIRYAIERSHAEEEVRKSEANFRNIINNNADAMLIIENGIIHYVNPAAERLFDRSYDDMVGSTFEYPLNPHESVEIIIERPDTTHAVAGMKTVETVWEGKKVFLAVLRDITENIKIQKTLQQQKNKLKERIKELKCIYRIGELIRGENTSMEDVLQEIVKIIPEGWQMSSRTGCRITWGDSTFVENFTESPWTLKADIKSIYGTGTIEVSYLKEKKEEKGDDPFLKEEHDLLRAVADQIGEFIERKTAKEILKENERKYRTIFNNSSDAIFIHTVEGTFLEVNRVAIDRLGYSKDEFLTFTPHDIDTPYYAAFIPDRIEKITKEGYDLFETAQVTKDGDTIPTEISSRLIEFEGNPAILCVARDISARKRAEKELQTSYLFLEAANKYNRMNPLLEEFLTIIKDLTDCEAVGIQIIDEQGTIPYKAQIGFTQDYVDTEINCHPGSHHCVCADIFFRTIDSHPSWYTEGGSFFIDHADQESSPMSATDECTGPCALDTYQSLALIPIPANDHNIGILHIADSRPCNLQHETISVLEKAAMQLGIAIQRIKIREELQTSEETARALLNAMTEAAFLMDLDGTIISANEEFCRRLHVSMEDATGIYSFDLLPPEVAARRKQIVEELISTGTPVQFDDVRNGRYIQNSIYPIFNSQGGIEKLAVFGFDMTEQKKAEEKIRASLKEKEILLKEIHHRVKNNMQIVSSLLNLQSRYVTDDKIIHILQECQNRIRSMALVHEKLYHSEDLSKINSISYVETLIKDVLRTFGEGTAHININLEIDNVFLDIDIAIPCGLIINELLSNAYKHAFSDRKEGTIGISLHMNKDGQYELQVSDDGIGIPPTIDLETAESLGLQLVNILVKNQLKGTMKMERSSGTHYTIIFGEGNE